ncbi:general secretion pathway protein GspB [Alteromonas oceanisediminis]|uniref:general secretion pathway protein GspB n=1 Tax=Alteromonas oceanisediminis TaxID=2836180 RepID=UPI001BD992F1|nr:general secretion pathway protein GspB [Alteromonas oceanisediminis]MBT0585091.1 general secretion pathway protein GspB [Alteromonas oceanisediminis]
MLKVIKISELQPGMMITQVVEQQGPVKIRKVGLVKSADMVTGLAEMGVLSVEVDTEQTIEMEAPIAATSMTQKLLQGEYDHASQVDKSLSEQFNRSLFLPSVSELPSAWQIYARQVGMIFAVVLIGLAVGVSGAIAPSYISQYMSEDRAIAEVKEPDAVAVDEPEQHATVQTPTDTAAQPAQSEQDVVAQVPAEPTPIQNSVSGEAPSSSSETVQEPEGELLTQGNDTSTAQVSPELMARFNKALADLENEPVSTEPETTVSVYDDIPRVDQLPARTLTLLPSMAFSAHMYASSRDARWVRVNGQQLYEGEYITDEVQLINIEPQRVILSFRGDLFSMAALTDW